MNKQLSQILRGAIIASHGSVEAFSAAINLSPSSVNRVLRGDSPYGDKRRERWEKALCLMVYDAAVVVVVPTRKMCDGCESKRLPGGFTQDKLKTVTRLRSLETLRRYHRLSSSL